MHKLMVMYPHPDDPSLLFPGDVITLPPLDDRP